MQHFKKLICYQNLSKCHFQLAHLSQIVYCEISKTNTSQLCIDAGIGFIGILLSDSPSIYCHFYPFPKMKRKYWFSLYRPIQPQICILIPIHGWECIADTETFPKNVTIIGIGSLRYSKPLNVLINVLRHDFFVLCPNRYLYTACLH